MSQNRNDRAKLKLIVQHTLSIAKLFPCIKLPYFFFDFMLKRLAGVREIDDRSMKGIELQKSILLRVFWDMKSVELKMF